jgi:pyrroloquinoline quinone (PQQ) biosynthesis protein C
MTHEEALEVRCQIAGARLGVAEQLRTAISILAAWVCFLYFESWLASIAVWLALELLVPSWYSKQYDAAWDDYEKATNTGRYWKGN